MDIIQEIKKCQEKIDANTERIFKLQRGGVIMYRIYVVGVDKENKSHMISTRDFEYYEDTTALIGYALERIMGAPLFCVPNRLFLKKLDDSELAGKYEFRSNSIETNTQDACRFVYGWIQRDTFTSDDESYDESDDESDDGECGDLASKYNAIAAGPVIIMGSEPEQTRIPRKLFI